MGSVVAVALAALPAPAASGPPAASADAYGLLVDVTVLPSLVDVSDGPVARAAQEFPVAATAPDEAHVARSGPHPSDGSVVRSVGVLTSSATAAAAPSGAAEAQVNDVALLDGLVTADTVRAQATSGCTDGADTAGTIFENLQVNGQRVDYTPAPNTVFDLGVVTVILNEQHPTADGSGVVVNAIHVVSTLRGDALFRGDVVVAHAMTTVSCPGAAVGPGDDDDQNDKPLAFDLTATPVVAEPGTEVTYTVRVANTAETPVLVNALIDHLPAPMEFVSTSGDLGDEPDATTVRPNGGVDVSVGNGTTIPAGETVEQRFVGRVADDADPASYFNNVELFLASLGNYAAGLDTPVQAVEERPEVPAAPAGSSGGEQPDESEESDDAGREDALPSTGAPLTSYVVACAALLGLARMTRRLLTDQE